MDSNTVNAVKDAITPLVNKLGEWGVAGFELATRQVYAEAIQSVVMAVIWGILAAVAVKVFRKGMKILDEGTWEQEEGGFALSLIGGLAALTCGGFSLGELYYSIPKFINPQWYAIEKLAGLLTGAQ